MRRFGLRARLVIAAAIITLLAGIVIERLTSHELERAMVARVAAELDTKIALLDDALAQRAPGEDLDAAARRFAAHASVRVTLLARDGAVLVDSGVDRQAAAALENHATRPEIVEARTRGVGQAVRASPTLRTRMIYVARRDPAGRAGEPVAFTRLAVPLVDADVAIASAQRAIALGTAVAMAFAALLFGTGAHLATAPIRKLTQAARAMADGELSGRAPARGRDEIAMLGRALNALAAQLSRTIEELRADRDVLSGILDGMSEGVLLLDDDLGIVLANRAVRAALRLDENAIGRAMTEVVQSQSLLDALEAARAGDLPQAREVELGDVLARRMLVRVSRLPADRGALLAVFHDVTDLRRLETIRTDFVANVSHELRTPVTAISTATETLLGGALDDPEAAHEFVEVIDRHSARLRHLVDDLLDLAKIEAKGFRLALRDFGVGPVVEQAVRLLEAAASARRAHVSIDVPAALPRVHADPRALEQVISNLVDNALKYGSEGVHVKVIAREVDGGAVEIAVADDGPGIPRAHQGRIFERFYRVDPGRSRELRGTGLGLSIVKHMTELMDGTVEVESYPGKGATFRVTIPAAS